MKFNLHSNYNSQSLKLLHMGNHKIAIQKQNSHRITNRPTKSATEFQIIKDSKQKNKNFERPR
jgi:hypothetical protein